jgi:hypothetical protein
METVGLVLAGIGGYLWYKHPAPAPRAHVTFWEKGEFLLQSTVDHGKIQIPVDLEIRSIILSNGHSLPPDTKEEAVQAIVDQIRILSIMDSGPVWKLVYVNELADRFKRVRDYYKK